METKLPEPDCTIKIKLAFILFGISSLLPWNAILTQIVFFNNHVNSIKPMKSFSFLNFAFNIVLQFVLLWKKDLFKIKYQLIVGLISSICFLILIPTLVIVLEGKAIINFLTVILVLIMGLTNALLSSGFFTLASFFPTAQIVELSAGQGFSGIIVNAIQYFILFFTNGDSKVGIMIFFIISCVILLTTLIVLIFSLKSEFFTYYLEFQSNNEVNEIDAGNEIANNDNIKEEEENLLKPKLTFYQMFNILKEMDILCCILYIVTFAEYPLGFDIVLFEPPKYSMNTILTIYNCFDTLGRYLTAYIKASKILIYIIVLSRIILLVTIPVAFNLALKGNGLSIFGLIINDSLLAITNGIGTTLIFAFAPSLVNDEYKGQAGASVSFFIIVGICLGSVLQFATDPIFESLKKNK
jgi:equilibrative nucleoside transporter 1/2/3